MDDRFARMRDELALRLSSVVSRALQRFCALCGV